MKKISNFLIITLSIIFIVSCTKNSNNNILFSDSGDLNNDGKIDKIYLVKENEKKNLIIDFGKNKKVVDLSRLDIKDLQLCNIDGGSLEIFISTKKSTMLHQEVIERPFFFKHRRR